MSQKGWFLQGASKGVRKQKQGLKEDVSKKLSTG